MADRIMIVEDEPRLREILSDYIRSKGDEPVPMADGIQAIAYLEEHSVDAVLLDILMPELDGFSVCRRVRKDSTVPIIFLTALSDEDDKLLGYELGADDYVTKPYSMAVLYAKTKALISRSRGAVGRAGILSAGGVTLDLHNATADIGGEQTFAVENTGQQLPAEQLTKVWAAFWQGDASRQQKGTGLGLAICKTILELHGGTCRAENTPNGVNFIADLSP